MERSSRRFAVRLIHPVHIRGMRTNAVAVALAMMVVGGTALALIALLPPDRPAALALLGLSATLGFGVGIAMVWRERGAARRRRDEIGDDIARLLAPALDDTYTLVLAPRLPGVGADLAALLVGPAGVRALVARRWRGHYRVRGRGWEIDTRSRAGWIPTLTNPSFDADAVADAVTRWLRSAVDDAAIGITPAVAFPRPDSTIVLEEPIGEIVTTDNAPWWAQSIGRVQRLDGSRAARFVEAVLSASEAEASGAARSTAPRVA
jgi:hypothetical protein